MDIHLRQVVFLAQVKQSVQMGRTGMDCAVANKSEQVHLAVIFLDMINRAHKGGIFEKGAVSNT